VIGAADFERVDFEAERLPLEIGPKMAREFTE
jgi:hypothetical protein